MQAEGTALASESGISTTIIDETNYNVMRRSAKYNYTIQSLKQVADCVADCGAKKSEQQMKDIDINVGHWLQNKEVEISAVNDDYEQDVTPTSRRCTAVGGGSMNSHYLESNSNVISSFCATHKQDQFAIGSPASPTVFTHNQIESDFIVDNIAELELIDATPSPEFPTHGNSSSAHLIDSTSSHIQVDTVADGVILAEIEPSPSPVFQTNNNNSVSNVIPSSSDSSV